MKSLFTVFLTLTFLFFSVRETKAIIVVVPVILVPIVNIVVWIIGAIATPVVGLSAFYFKLKNKSPFLGIVVGVGIVLLLGVLMVLIFKLVNPQRPIY